MEVLTGTSFPVFLGFTVVLMGFVSFATGRAIADGWRPAWLLWPYGLLLGIVDRFLVFALFGAEPLMLRGYLLDTFVILLVGWIGYRLTRTHRMATQYPWIYERVGPFRLRQKDNW